MGAVEIGVEGGVLEIRLAQAGGPNVIGLEEAHALRDAATGLGHGPGSRWAGVGCVLILADGDDFCLGGNLREFAAAADIRAHVGEVAGALNDAVYALLAQGAPVVTAVQGWAAGGGVGLAACGDVVLAAAGARFRSAYTAIGLTPDGGLSWLLPRVAGVSRAADFIVTNRVLDAAQAAEWGLVTRVISPPEELHASARELAAQLARGPLAAHARVRSLLRGHALASLRAALDDEVAAIAASVDTPDGREGVRAFLERRRPEFAEVIGDA